MNLSKFFVDRPNFAAVISILIFLAGVLAIPKLPISEYPEVVPPSVVVRAQFPGANPKVIAETVATPLEEQINGVENMLYMSSQAASDGVLTLTVTFKLGTDPDLAARLVQNRVNEALPRLPEVTRQLGVSTVKSSPDLTMVVHLISPSDRYDNLYLRNYALLNVKDELSRIPGIGQIKLYGSGNYAMRVWLNPQKIAARNMNPDEVVAAIRKQNIQVAAGVVGGPPYKDNVEIQLPVNVQGRLADLDQFENIIVKREGGVVTYLRDVARVEMGASEYALRALLGNQQALALVIFQTPGANAIDISNNVRAKMAELNKHFPDGLEYRIAYDPTTFVHDSIKAVIHTLLEAIVLVVIVFLQTWRAGHPPTPPDRRRRQSRAS
jgi:multidrug efflux pump subunit AcrB